jgi:RimJ/RimL family protein N-acetyltransferase
VNVLATPRLMLRTARLGDAALFLALVTDPDFIAYVGDRGIESLRAARTALRDGPIRMQAELGHSVYVVERRDGVALGMCGLIRRDGLDGVDIGYAFLPAARGQGYAREAAQAVVDYAKDGLGLPRLLAVVDPKNHKSVSLLQNIGLQFDKIVHLFPHDPAVHLYVIAFADS